MTNIGNNPTFMRQYRRVETHVINWEGNLYGKTVSVRFYKRIRDEKKFASITELVDAMKMMRNMYYHIFLYFSNCVKRISMIKSNHRYTLILFTEGVIMYEVF